MIKLPKNLTEKLFKQSRAEAPIEACGYLVGKNDTVSQHHPLTNIDQSTEHFSLDTKEQFKAVKSARQAGLDILAVYHSHPETPARPSEEDIKLAFDPKISYVILSLLDNNIKSFKIIDKQVQPEEMEVIEN